MEVKTTNPKAESKKEKQVSITQVTTSTKRAASGALWVFNPTGSSYMDRNANPPVKVIRDQPTLQYAKAGVPQKYALGLQDMLNFEEFLKSKEWAAIKEVLPDSPAVEPNTV